MPLLTLIPEFLMRQAIPIAKTSLCLAQVHRLRTVHLLNEAYETVLELHKTRPDVIVVNVETRIVEGASFDGGVWAVNIMTGILWSESASLVSLGPSATSVLNQLDPLSMSLPRVAGSTWARAPQSSKARQWVEVRDWWSHSMLLTNACAYKPRWQSPPPSERRSHLFSSASTNLGRVAFLTTTKTTEGDLNLAPLTAVPRRCCSGAGVW
ncbi:hypothetical protein AGABI1DRAFT_133419 [Agaricus bisporus var. burnettii JB137-S8]|uniref:Uncharacterized protein n=1 Tax=Agaricus bisporus var. burnettii (strain JB137-S8 / ATCC MYA-4627 / FGSC 10392) TaxID=597362 RepID=K5WU61_AGABU|nr:uncharacterized protein AGABI1DRAFT_133419 [Agaricus bisporus var. burnettii JB137-S8]EKM74293.1 hypothetical protein AGABI1DRAFT_133419 [Agaricus bisporus var. burnettii JB137-S8]